MAVERVLAIRREKLHELAPLLVGEARADADVLQVAGVVVETEQQRADGVSLAALVPAEAGDDAVAVALVLHLEHHALVRLVDAARRLRHHAVEAGALEAPEPVARRRARSRVAGVRWSGGCAPRQQRLERRAPLAKRASARRSRSPSHSRSKNTIDAGISSDSIFTRDAAG